MQEHQETQEENGARDQSCFVVFPAIPEIPVIPAKKHPGDIVQRGKAWPDAWLE